jgi:hypothetical protein
MSGIITGSFLFSVESGYRVLYENNYLKLLKKLWYPRLTKIFNTDSKSEIFEWLIQSSTIDQLSPQDGGENSGAINYEQMSSCLKTISPAHHAKGFEIGKMEWENRLNRGMDPVGTWIGAAGTYAAYYPQKQVAGTILNGGSIIGYDGKALFATNHPVNPNIPSLGTFANDFTGSPVAATPGVVGSGYPGALPIDDSVDVSTALTNLTKAIAYVTGSVTQPNGQDCRMLEVAYIMHPPRMTARVQQLTNTQDVKFGNLIAQAVGSAGGSADVSAIIKNFQLAEPIEVKEFDGNRTFTYGPPNFEAQVNGNDKTYYLVCREAEETQLGAILMNNRQPFKLTTYSGESGYDGVDAVLNTSQKVRYHHQAYMGFDVGHPWTIFRFQGS